MKSLLIQKLYHICSGFYFGLFISLILFETGMLLLSRMSDVYQIDFWSAGFVLCIMMVILCNSKSQSAWVRYRAVMPFSHHRIVAAEYLFLLGSTFVFTLLVSIFPLLNMLLNNSFDAKQMVFGSISVFSLSLLPFLFSTPPKLFFGDKELNILAVIVAMLFCCFGILFISCGDDIILSVTTFVMNHDMLMMGLCEAGIMIVLTAASWLLSVLILPAREY